MQQNEMFILGLTNDEIKDAIEKGDYKLISERLYRVQKISTTNYMFRHHLETQIIDDDNSKKSKRFINVRSIGALFALNPFKLKIDRLGNIIKS
jgi:CRISPR-associated endonuclease Csn1